MKDWSNNWTPLATGHQKIAEDALAKGNNLTATDAFFRASQYNHFAQFHEFQIIPLKNEAFRRKIENCRRKAPTFQPPAQRIEILSENVLLIGYFRLSESRNKKPLWY